ncbi:endolytic transglycosylase MltG [Pallidibacillus pasinlerensis]|uniref:Endolytic murein transglycosylase n=1 Tax=Pallidibacillus pasinlerensis TaxID=2703818 RepID=A0ABX0A8P9_9BACI|nr:endolytic transglycosylase MltG [Pallidibacillus pasinlerensis]NCU17497.1 endolytic transglycosylase MltG [Pallidibacillus pasinlerensis]
MATKEEGKSQEKDSALMEKYKEAKLTRRIVFIITSTILLLLAGTITGAVLFVSSALKPVDPDSQEIIEVEIPYGSGSSTIARILEENGIIKNATVFKYYLKFNNESNFQAGSYKLTQSMTLDEIIASLKTGKVMQDVLSITIPEGIHVREIADRIAEKTDYSAQEILDTINSVNFIQTVREKYPDLVTEEILQENVKYPLEGYLFPATYGFSEENPPIEEIIMPMIDKTFEVIKPYMADIKNKGFTVHEVLTLASLIEEEAPDEENRKIISSVFYNRIEKGMPLQTDPTVIYAMGEHKERLTFKDYEYEDPYNTYVIDGLPPGPIANAGVSSIDAALYPPSTDYLFFLATPEGEVLYSESFEQHEKYYDEHIANRD